MLNKFYLFILGLFMLCACETVVEIDIPLQDRELAVQSLFNQDSLWQVYVSHSKHILDIGAFAAVPNATVKIFENDQEVETLAWDEKEDYYQSQQHIPKPGNTYRISVAAEGFETVEAESYLPAMVPIKSLELDTTNLIELSEYQHYYKLTLVFDDPKGINFYDLTVTSQEISKRTVQFYDGIGYRDSVFIDTLFQEVSLTAVDPALESEQYGAGILFNDINFDGREYILEALINANIVKGRYYRYPDIRGEEVDIKLTFIFQHLTEEKYLFLKTADIQKSVEGDPFAEPMPVFNNIQHGLGIFAGCQQDVRVMKVK